MSSDPSITVFFVRSEGPGRLTLLMNGFPLAQRDLVTPDMEWLDMTDIHNVASGNAITIEWIGLDAEAPAPAFSCLARHYPQPDTVVPELGDPLRLTAASGVYDEVADVMRMVPTGLTMSAELGFVAPGHDFKEVYYGPNFVSEEEAIRSAGALYNWLQTGNVSSIMTALSGRIDDIAQINAVPPEETAVSHRQAVAEIIEDFRKSPRSADDIEVIPYCEGRLQEVTFAGQPFLETLNPDEDGATFEIPAFIGKRRGKLTILR